MATSMGVISAAGKGDGTFLLLTSRFLKSVSVKWVLSMSGRQQRGGDF